MDLLPTLSGRLTTAVFHTDRMLAGTSEGWFDIYDLPSGRLGWHLRCLSGEVKAIATSPDADSLLAVSSNGEICAWSPGKGPPRPIPGGMGNAHARLAMQGRQAVVSMTTFYRDYEGTRLLWLEEEQVVASAFLPKIDVRGLWLVGGEAIGLFDGRLVCLRPDLGWEVLPGPSQEILAWEPQSDLRVEADETCQVWLRRPDGRQLPLGNGGQLRASRFVFAPEAGELVVVEALLGSDLVRASRFDVETGRRLSELEVEAFLDGQVDPGRRWLLVGGSEGDLRAVDLVHGGPVPVLRSPVRVISRAAAIGREGPVLVAWEQQRGLFLHQPGQGAGVAVPGLEGARIERVELSADGRLAVALDWAGDARVLSLDPPAPLKTVRVFGPDEVRGEWLPPIEIRADGHVLSRGDFEDAPPAPQLPAGVESEGSLLELVWSPERSCFAALSARVVEEAPEEGPSELLFTDEGLRHATSYSLRVFSAAGQQRWSFSTFPRPRLVGPDEQDRVVLIEKDRLLVYTRAGEGGERILEHLALPGGEFVALDRGQPLYSAGALRWSGFVEEGRVLEAPGGRCLPGPGLPAAFAAHVGPGMDLSDSDLRGADLDGADLSSASLQGSDLRLVSLRGTDLRGARLDGARLDGAHLGLARLEGARLDGARLWDATLFEAEAPSLAGALGTLRPFHPRRGPDDPLVEAIHLDERGEQLALVIFDQQAWRLELYEVGSGRQRLCLPIPEGLRLVFAHDGGLYLLGTGVSLFRDGHCVARRPEALPEPAPRGFGLEHEAPAAVSQDGALLAVLTSRSLVLLDARTLATLHEEPLEVEEDSRPGSLAFCGGALYILQRQGWMRSSLERLELGPEGPRRAEVELEGMDHRVLAIAAGADNRLRLVDDDGQGWVLEEEGPRALGRITEINNFFQVSLTHAGSRMLACESEPSSWLLESGAGRITCKVSAHSRRSFSSTVASGDGSMVAAWDRLAGAVRLWRLVEAETWPDGRQRVLCFRALYPSVEGDWVLVGPEGILGRADGERVLVSLLPSGAITDL